MLLKVFSFLETKFLLFLVDTVPLRIEVGKAAESLKEGTFLEESLSVVILKT